MPRDDPHSPVGDPADENPCPSPASQDRAAADLAESLAEVMTASTVIVCVGNELRGDDGAGVQVARRLADSAPWTVIDAQTVPENFLAKIVSGSPESVILVDALDFDAEPGAVKVVEAGRITGQGPSTHGPAPLAFLDILYMMHPCRRFVLGIQPMHSTLDKGLSPPVARAVDLVVAALQALAKHRPPTTTTG